MIDKKNLNLDSENNNSEQKKEKSAAGRILDKLDSLKNKEIDETDNHSSSKVEAEKTEEPVEKSKSESKHSEEDETQKTEGNSSDDSEEGEVSKTEIQKEKPEVKEEKDYELLPREELVSELKTVIAEFSKGFGQRQVNQIKSAFNTKTKEFRAEQLQKQEEQRKQNKENEEDDSVESSIEKDTLPEMFNEQLKKWSEKKQEIKKAEKEQREKNAERKKQIIKEIESLINKPESFGKTFQEFKAFQDQWEKAGTVPKAVNQGLWNDYHAAVERFYNYVKINKELRDLDLQKNTEKKEQLCLEAEKLLEVEEIINAHKQLQKLHDKWRETGPAYNSVKEELWERFKKPTSVINDKHQEKYKFIKEQQEKNLESKKFLCDKAEEAAGGEYKSNSDWKKASALVQKYQKLWSNIGYVPKQYNQSIYNRFSSACDSFFSGMREHFREVNEARGENLEKKKELLKQAEERKDSTDWGKETKFFKQIQSDWKNIGPVPRKHSDKIWKKFRAACNTFFENKRDFFDQRKSGEEENLELKNKLVQEILEYETQGKDEDLKKIKDFQTSWTKIGFVPLSDKDKIQEQYREAMEKLYENAGIDKSVANAMKFSDKVKALESADESRILAEIGKLRSKVEEKTKEIKLWENNMGFFADNKGSEGMKKEFTKKIENAEKEVEKFRSMIQELVNL